MLDVGGLQELDVRTDAFFVGCGFVGFVRSIILRNQKYGKETRK